ncbi:asparagine synthase (glutamine-hydrolyzing) [Motiliproteus coralliicola]|uniref:asparagine synthase (glutamine-hydrolyzing) n=1 Tax=Motiliproteus coralliicola TaxID=2283196 RepID=A0A369WW71_9GAMM|nr:asparagine synthase (glutamine-hydrolyzing) [Motiliproteus coralliicola]RDE24796.1 asparagine synthase (glutamine-hydrolyzing) [Motiliproteus coralliicola]
MCGIHGLISLSGQQPVLDAHLQAMGDITVHRGPDDSGHHIAEGVGIGMRRLSIIDLAGGHQPISNADDSLQLVCNGEIYNFRELRQQMQERGYQFKTGSDVEVILPLYEAYGDDCINHLNGMFAFALHDRKRRRTLIARDRLGIKPLYYARSETHNGDYLAFSTEAKAILALPMFQAELNHEALPAYLQLGYVPAPQTMFKGVDKLEVASSLVIEHGNVRVRQYWQPDFTPKQQSPQEWAEQVGEKIEQAVKRQMVSDVPIGAFLSGGIDSSAVVAMMAKHSSQPVKTYAIGFDTGKAGKFFNELPYARQVAELFGTDHREILVRPDIVELLPKLLWHMDEPIADSAYITTYLVSEFARRDVTVILSGVGGDELFAGYRRYQGEHYIGHYHRVPAWLRRNLVAPLARRLPADRHSKWLNYMRLARSFINSAELSFDERYQSYIEVFSKDLQDQLLLKPSPRSDRTSRLLSQSRAHERLWKMFDLDRQTQLPDDLLMLTDKMSMATSLECRVPLLDQELVDLATGIPEQTLLAKGELKTVLKRSLKGVLPDSILYRAKRGFGAPMGAWLKSELTGLRASLLNQQAVEARGLFDWQVIARTIEQHDRNQADHTEHLLALMNLEIWCRLYLDGTSSTTMSETLKEAI